MEVVSVFIAIAGIFALLFGVGFLIMLIGPWLMGTIPGAISLIVAGIVLLWLSYYVIKESM